MNEWIALFSHTWLLFSGDVRETGFTFDPIVPQCDRQEMFHFRREFIALLASPSPLNFKRRKLALSQTHSTVGRGVPEPSSPLSSTSRAAVHLSRPELENMCLLLLQNGLRTLRWPGHLWPATLPTTRRPTGTLRQDHQCPTRWDKNVGLHLCKYLENAVFFNTFLFPCSLTQRDLLCVQLKFSSYSVVCFPELLPRAMFEFS